MAVATFYGLTPVRTFLQYFGLIAAVNLLFFALLRCGINKRFSDPSLTVPQITAAILIFLFVEIYTGPVRGAYLVVLLIAFNFGAFKLRTSTLFLLTMATVFGYAALIPYVRKIEGDGFNLPVALIELLTLTFALIAQTVLIGSISRLRRRLSLSNAKLQEALHQVTELATRDELTGAYNRRYILDILEHERHRVDRNGASFCICLIDLDHFKQLNDSYGHAGGDLALKAFVRGVRGVQRDTDLMARYGGEEFLLFLPQTSLTIGFTCAERVRAETSRLNMKNLPLATQLTVSIGVAQYQAGESIDQLIARADDALYAAKRGGRNRVEAAIHSADGTASAA
jgi:diguanylate cyclase (GGDEF)-like protein